MRLKSFYAKTMTEAMKMVRETLGEEAVIVATRDERGGKAVRVTAAIDPSSYDETGFTDPAFETHGHQRPATADTWLQYDDEDEESSVAEDITDAMLRHAVPEDVMDHILSCATVIGFDEPGVALIASIEHLFQFAPLPSKSYNKALMFVGPPGAGKTLAVAKMAARGVMNGLNIGVISTDSQRAGGFEQLQSLTNLLHIDLLKAESPKQLAAQISRLQTCHQVLIDTAGMNPFDTQDVKALAQMIGAAEIEPHLVLPGGIDAEESGEIGRIFSTVGVQALIPSRIDIARRLGGLLSAAHHGGLSFAHGANTPKIADGLFSLNPKTLSRLLMPSAFRDSEQTRPSEQSTNTPRKTRRTTGTFQ